MDELIKQAAPLAPLLWPFILTALWHLDRRMRGIEQRQAAHTAMLEMLVSNHRMVNGEKNAPILFSPD